MANEAILLKQFDIPTSFTVSDSTGIEKGTILKFADPYTASASAANQDMVAGIAACEKIASDGITKLAVHRSGEFKVYLSGACTAGDALATTITPWLNYVQAIGVFGTGLSGSRVLGYALETGTNGEQIRMRLAPQVGYAVTA